MATDTPTLQTDQYGALAPSDVTALMNQTKQGLVAKYPYLANNPDFNNDLTQAFSNFTKEGVQVGSDYNDVFNKTVLPFTAKWDAKAAQDTAKTQETQELAALKVAKDTGSPTAAMQAFPQLLSPQSKFRAEWVGRINKADEAPNKPRLSLSQSDAHSALQKQLNNALANSADPSTDEKVAAASKALMDFDSSVTPQLTPGNQLQPSAAAGPVASPAPAPAAPGVAAPMGTSGYVNYAVPAGMRPQGTSFIGNPTAAQAADLLQQWQARTGGAQVAAAGPGGQTPPPPGPPGPKLTPPSGQISFTDASGNVSNTPPVPAANLGQLQQAEQTRTNPGAKNIPVINSQNDYDNLPPGAQYYDPNGNLLQKAGTPPQQQSFGGPGYGVRYR